MTDITAPRGLPSSVAKLSLTTIRASFPAKYVLLAELNRPKAHNALSSKMWTELLLLFNTAHYDPEVRVVILSNVPEARVFCAGLDLKEFGFESNHDLDPARIGYRFYSSCRDMQACVSSIERCAKPVLALVDGACIGGAVDIITACDIRFATTRSYFTVKEVDIGLAADIGTLQRLPRVIGDLGFVKEVCLTGRNFSTEEALQVGLLRKVFATRDAASESVLDLAKEIAAKSPVPVVGTKIAINYAINHSTEQSLDQIAMWNMAMHNTGDMVKAISASFGKKGIKDPDVFSKL